MDQISVNIGRHGDLLFNDGRHRLTFVKLLSLTPIPVVIAVRHREWFDFKRELLEYVLQTYGGKIYAPLLHPDLEWIPSHYGHKRFELIRRNIHAKSGRLLDIGAHWGYFCHRMEDLGFECTGVELNKRDFYFLTKLKRASNKKFETVNQSIFEFIDQGYGDRFDVILALAVFHHFVKTHEGVEELKKLLSTLRVREIFFLPHKPSEPQMQNVYWNPSEHEFVSFILQHSNLSRSDQVGYAEDGRPLFHLY